MVHGLILSGLQYQVVYINKFLINIRNKLQREELSNDLWKWKIYKIDLHLVLS